MSNAKRRLRFGTFSNYDFHKDEDIFKRILAESPGDAIAMVKCFLFIASRTMKDTRIAECTYPEIIDATGLSRPMISRGIALLLSENFNQMEKGEKRSQYKLKSLNRSFNGQLPYGFASVPCVPINEFLRYVPNRGVFARLAMVIYVYLLTITDNKEPIAKVAYDRISERLGIKRSEIKPALCILYEACLVSCIPAKYIESNNRESNIYHIRGLDSTKAEYSYYNEYMKNKSQPHHIPYHPYAY